MSTVPHTVLPVLPATGLLRERVAGRPLAWSRDIALVGGLTSGFAPFAAGSLAPSGYAPTALVLGLVTGALLGLCMPALLEQVRGRAPLAGLLLLSPVAGFAWGALAGGLAGLPFGSSSAILGFCCGWVCFFCLWFGLCGGFQRLCGIDLGIECCNLCKQRIYLCNECG